MAFSSLRYLLIAGLLGGGSTVAAKSPADAVRIEISAPIDALVTDATTFRPFAIRVRDEVERLLEVPAVVDDAATLRMLLSTRVHLAHSLADNDRAVATAAWIRSLQTNPADKAFVGLTTLAAVAARRATHNAAPDSAAYLAVFEREFAAQLAALPRTAQIVAMLRSQRERMVAMTRESLLAETSEKLAQQLRGRATCTLAEADAIVRVQHRLDCIVPTREVTLRALDEAIAARTR